MSDYPATPRLFSRSYVLAACLLAGLSACQRPVAYFQRSPHEAFYTSAQKPLHPADSVLTRRATETNPLTTPERTDPPVFYAETTLPADPAKAPDTYPAQPTYPVAERIQQHQTTARRLLSQSAETPAPTTAQSATQQQPGPGPKAKAGQRKTLREWLGLPPRKKLNWWQRISWQLKAAVILILVAVVFAILGITLLSIVFGVIGALLLIRGLKKSFKVRRPWF